MPIKVDFNAGEIAIDGNILPADLDNALINLDGVGLGVQSGTSSVVIAVAGTAVTVTITFAVPFATIPKVFVALTGVTGDAGYIVLRASTISQTQVVITGNSYLAQTLNFDWAAIG